MAERRVRAAQAVRTFLFIGRAICAILPMAMNGYLKVCWKMLKFALAAAGTLAVFVAVAIIVEIPGSKLFGRYLEYPNKDALLAAEAPNVMHVAECVANGMNVTVVVMKPCRLLASGPGVLVYNEDGKLIDNTIDEGDDSRFQREWGGVWREAAREKTRRWLRETRLPEVQLAAPATMADFAAYMEQASKDFDRPDIPKDNRGIRFRCCQSAAKIVFPEKPKSEQPLVETLPCGDMSFWDALTNACARTGCTYRIYDREVYICNCQ